MKRNEARSALNDITRHAMTVVAIEQHLPIVKESGLVRLMPHLDDVADTLSRTLIQGGLRLSLTVNPLSCSLPADDVILIGSMLAGLVTRAVKRAGGGALHGTIAISFEMAGPHWRLTVSNGAGHETQTGTSVVEAIVWELHRNGNRSVSDNKA
jgi:hypothetical protein